QGKPRAPTGGWALCRDRAAMRLHDTPGNRKTEPCSVTPIGSVAARLDELFEDLGQHIGSDAGTVIAYKQRDAIGRYIGRDGHMGFRGRVRDRVRYNITQSALCQSGVGSHPRQLARHLNGEGLRCPPAFWGRYHALDDLTKIDPVGPDFERA